VLAADPEDAGRRAAGEARAALGGAQPSFGVLFASADFLGSAATLLGAISAQTGPLPLIGCVAEGVVGGAREVESGPAVSLWLAAGLGPVETFAMDFVRTASGGAIGGYRFERGRPGAHLMICDPFTFPADDLLGHLNEHVRGTVVMGGLASGGLDRRQSRLFLDDRVLSQGAVGAYLPEAELHTLVSQGCRPVGDPFTITAATGNVIQELGGRPPIERLQELAAAMSDHEREQLASGLHVGMVINEYQAERRQGDFVIRGVIAADQETGAIAVGDQVDVGQTLQFQVRDATSADEDLRRTLEGEIAALAGRPAAGALLFTCNGRGSRLFAEPNHDAGMLARLMGDMPVAGFSCAGELGPVGGRNYLHGFTASIALFPAAESPGARLPAAESPAAESPGAQSPEAESPGTE
jgi:small ligand-binding sensory domain FIST